MPDVPRLPPETLNASFEQLGITKLLAQKHGPRFWIVRLWTDSKKKVCSNGEDFVDALVEAMHALQVLKDYQPKDGG